MRFLVPLVLLVLLSTSALTLVVRMMKMRGKKLWCSSSPGSSLARQL